MDSYRRFHSRFLNKRQGLGGVLSSLLPSASGSPTSDPSTPSAPSQSTSNPGGPGGIIGGITSLAGGVIPSSAPSSAATPSTPATHPSSSSTGSTTASASTHSTSSATISSSSAVPSTPTPTPASTASSPDIVYTSSDGTSVVYVTSTLPAASPTAAASTSFLQNPSLEGGVFALVGIVVLVITFVIVTWTIRKRNRSRLERDLAAAVTFDPGATDLYERQDSFEKHRLSGSSSGHDHGYGMPYFPQQDYRGPMGYGQYHPPVSYPTPSPNPVPYQASSPTVPQPAAQSGANLTRKFSDRKPVPPLLPDPTYDPANAHVSIPPQFQQ